MSLIKMLREVRKTIDDPRNSNIVYGIDMFMRSLAFAPASLAATRRLRPQIAHLQAQGYFPAVDLATLESLPVGSLGHSYAKFMRDNGLNVIEPMLRTADGRPLNLVQYAAYRAFRLHDLLHVLLGCDTSVTGEARIVSFSLRQMGRNGGPAMMSLSALFVHLVLKQPSLVVPLLAECRVWWRRGADYGFHVSFRFEDMWHEPLEEVRARLANHVDRVV